MSTDPSGAGPGRTREFFIGGAASGTLGVLFGASAWIWVSRGEGSLPNDGAETWLTAVLIFAFVIAFLALVMPRRRALAWGVVAGAGGAVGVDLAWLLLAILRQSE